MTEYVKKGDVARMLYEADAITTHGMELLNAMPAEPVEERRMATRIDDTCSVCGHFVYIADDFCSNCGARMVEE